MTYATPQTYERLRPDPDVVGVAHSIGVTFDGLVLVADMEFLEFEEARLLRVTFGGEHGGVIAFTSHEEHHHPLGLAEEERPELGVGRWPGGAYPICKVIASGWISSFGAERAWQFERLLHYQLVSRLNIVDVLCCEPPSLRWVNIQQSVQPDRRKDAAPG